MRTPKTTFIVRATALTRNRAAISMLFPYRYVLIKSIAAIFAVPQIIYFQGHSTMYLALRDFHYTASRIISHLNSIVRNLMQADK